MSRDKDLIQPEKMGGLWIRNQSCYGLSMARYVSAVATPLSPTDAFAYMSDVTHFSEWDPGIKRVVRVSGDGAGVGTAYDLTVQGIGTTVMRYQVTEFEPPRRLLLVAHTTLLTSNDEITVAPTPGGSIVTYDASLTLNGFLGLFDPLLGIALQRIGDRGAIGLRRALRGTAVAR